MKWLQADQLTSNGLNKQLEQLATDAQKYPPLSLERQQTLDNLIRTILASGQLWCPHLEQNQHYEYVYQEALQNLWYYVCREIEQYDPQLGAVLAWVNMLLYRRFFPEAMSKVRNIREKTIPDLSYLLNSFTLSEKPALPTELLKECIESDPEGAFRQEYIENHPEANFQALMQRRVNGQMWKDISADLGIKQTTLISFYQRCIVKFRSKIKEYLRH